MASIISEALLDADPECAWAILRDIGAADRAFPGILTDCRLEGDVRTVTFSSGMIVRERIITIDMSRRRVAYSVIGGRFSHHSASMQIIPEDDGRCRFVWISDFLPDGAETVVRPLVDQGTAAFKAVAESAARGQQ